MATLTRSFVPGQVVVADTVENILKLDNRVNTADLVLITVKVGSFKFNAFGNAGDSNRTYIAGESVQITVDWSRGLSYKGVAVSDSFDYSV